MRLTRVGSAANIAFAFATLPFCIHAQNVGIGTNDPQEKLHISNGNLLIGPTTSNIGLSSFNPFLKLRARQTGSAGI